MLLSRHHLVDSILEYANAFRSGIATTSQHTPVSLGHTIKSPKGPSSSAA